MKSQKNDKTLTIIIPSYNMEEYLGTCIESLLIADNLDRLDIIVVNDGSTDTTSQIAHNYSDKYPDVIRVIDKQNGHYGSCVNRGLKEAKGKYIKVLDADDFYNTSNLSDYIAYLSQTNADMIITEWVKTTIKGKPYRHWKCNMKPREKYTLAALKDNNSFRAATMHAITYKTELLRCVDYFQPEGICYTDDIWRFTPLMAVKKVEYFDKIVYCYRMGREGQSMDVAQLARNASHHLKIAMFKLDVIQRHSHNIDNTTKHIMDWQMIANTKNILKYGILYGGLNNEEMIAFVKRLKLISPSIYDDALNNKKLQFANYKYATLWAKDKQNYHIPALIKALVSVNDLFEITIQKYKYLFH